MYDLGFLSFSEHVTQPSTLPVDQNYFEYAEALHFISEHLVSASGVDGLELLGDDRSMIGFCPDAIDAGDLFKGYVLVRFPDSDSGNWLHTFLAVEGQIECRTQSTITVSIAAHPVGIEDERIVSRALYEKALATGGEFVCHEGWINYQQAKYAQANQVAKHPVGSLLKMNEFSYALLVSEDFSHFFSNDNDSGCIDFVFRSAHKADKYEIVDCSSLQIIYESTLLDGVKKFGKYVFTNQRDDSKLIGILATDDQRIQRALRLNIGNGVADFRYEGISLSDRMTTGDWMN